ncbi:DedA family protein [Patescibacteria group bacterium]|nr:DedA family protein [Patescibacteria group bacterium]MBU2265335.1 DedA family protein [Patescibacteria group bacterium]
MALDQLILWLSDYKYLALFPLAVAEGPIITVIAGFFASLGYLNFWLAYIIIIIGDLVGDAVHYSFGRFGGRAFIDRWGKYLGVGPKQIGAIERQFDKRGDKLLFIGKMSQGIGGAFLVAAGLIKMPFSKFIFANLLATLIKSLLLLLLGFYFGHALSTINTYLERIALISLGAAIFGVLIYFLYFRKSRNLAP